MALDDRAFTYDLTTDRGKVRLRITDTREPGCFSDDEIDYFLSSAGSVDGAVAQALRVLLVDAARRTRLYSREGESYNDTAQVRALHDYLKDFGGQDAMPTVQVVFPALLPMDQNYDEDDP